MQEWLIHLVVSQPYLVYGTIIVLACAEGPILSMLGGVLIKLGFFSFIPLYLALMVGDLIGDAVWYWIGKKFGRRFIDRFGKYFNITDEAVAKVEGIFHKYKHRILFISKLSNGFGFALVTLMTAGMVRLPFWKYLSINIVGQFVWTGMLIAVGYFFGNTYVQVNNIFAKISVVALFIILIFAMHGYRKYLSNRANKMVI